MDHQEQHHQHHRKEREREKRHEKLAERDQNKWGLPIHPTWFVVLGIVLTVVALLTWTFFLSI